jgi:hypothetical protein
VYANGGPLCHFWPNRLFGQMGFWPNELSAKWVSAKRGRIGLSIFSSFVQKLFPRSCHVHCQDTRFFVNILRANSVYFFSILTTEKNNNTGLNRITTVTERRMFSNISWQNFTKSKHRYISVQEPSRNAENKVEIHFNSN